MGKIFNNEIIKWAMSAIIGVIAINLYYTSKDIVKTTSKNIQYIQQVRHIDSIQSVHIIDIKREYVHKRELNKLDSLNNVKTNNLLLNIQSSINNNNAILINLEKEVKLQKECIERMKGAWAAKGIDLTYTDTLKTEITF